MRPAELHGKLQQHGLLVLGVLELGGHRLVLIGNAGSDIWPVFISSPEYRDGQQDPLDRWSRRIGTGIATETGARVVFPFEGPPYPPFLDWAAQARIAFPSPVSMFIHPRYGLWHAYRFVLVFGQEVEGLFGVSHDSPCLSCADQPCLTACPVEAFTSGAYAVDRCLDYLAAEPESDCMGLGCAARRACPAGRKFTYQPDQARFHMDAFVRAQGKSPA